MIEQLIWLLKITRSQVIARRYFIVNGFDGTLTMLGLLVGFYVSKDVSLPVVVNADQLQMSWSMTRQQCINEDEPHHYGLAKLAELPSLAKRGWGRFPSVYRGRRALDPLQIPPAPLCEKRGGIGLKHNRQSRKSPRCPYSPKIVIDP